MVRLTSAWEMEETFKRSEKVALQSPRISTGEEEIKIERKCCAKSSERSCESMMKFVRPFGTTAHI
jgi:hypothetical protein